MREAYDIIKAMVRTEKGSTMLPLNKYLFLVATDANKVEIKKAVSEIYKVTATKVNIMNVKGKWKRLRYQEGKTASWKKAMVTLKSGDKIDIT
jgi:large subunit ribosomal protein L23